jgi:hypothetical protein
MNGQWIGEYNGTNRGVLMVNVDDMGSHFEGVAYLRPVGNDVPRTGIGFRTVNKDWAFLFTTNDLWAIHPKTANPAPWDTIKSLYPDNLQLVTQTEVSGQWDDRRLSLNWRTDLGTVGTSVLERSQADQPSELNAQSMKWEEFKAYVAQLVEKRHLFRGQSQAWRLRTTFHRRGRANLLRFVRDDIQVLHRRLSARTKHVFNLANADENGAFFNLVQHHGYPTPLLDWTYSPYVAAFFAYRNPPKLEATVPNAPSKVRIFLLDELWRTDISQIMTLDRDFPHFSVSEFIAIENERVIPQQSVSTVTNVDDIETYIRSREKEFGKSYLSAIDLPVSARAHVLRELAYMGVTAGSLFPGLDGACEELRERNF